MQLLIVSALLPVIADRLAKASTPEEKEKALLAIRVLDPACGSGHFLLAAARRLALELARIRAGDEEPSEELRQECLREVVAHCIYGVDKNPMAVELCKVALWIEAVDPGKPLSFLDAHIQCGDSLVGVFDPKVLEQGIPDEAYKPLTGDDKPTCTSLKKENASFRKAGQKGTLQGTLNLQSSPPINRSQQRLQEIEAMPETTLAEGSAKQAAFEAWEQERSSDPQTLAADLYTAAFFLPKTKDSRAKVPTSEHLLLLQSGQEIPGDLELAVEQAAKDFRFFHWHLRFGEVMDKGGFDCVLGNPPWERIKLQEKEFFAARSEAIATAPNKADRESLIKELRLRAKEVEETNEDPKRHPDVIMVREFDRVKREAEGSGEFIRGSGRFNLTAVGDLNTYALFAEHFLKLIGPAGRSGMIVPTGIATDDTTKAFFDEASGSNRIVSLISFENESFIFRDVHHAYKFCCLTLREFSDSEAPALFGFYIRQFSQLNDQSRFFELTSKDIAFLNPNSRTCPAFRSQMDAELSKRISRRNEVLVNKVTDRSGTWGISLRRMLDKSNDAMHLIPSASSPKEDRHLKVYEGRCGWQFDHRYASFLAGEYREVRPDEKHSELSINTEYYYPRDKFNQILSKYINSGHYADHAFLGFRRISRATDLRTSIACIFPCTPSTYGWILVLCSSPVDMALLCGLFNSLVFDYLLRNSLTQPSIPQGVFEQVPVPPRHIFDHTFLIPRVAELTYTTNDLKPWAEDLGFDGPPFRFDPEHRALLRAELDAFYAHLYGLTRDELRYILDPADVMGPDYPSETFRVLKNNEIRQFGEYRTQRLVLEAWDRLFGAMA